jgi:hypothetical protein
MGVLTGLAVGLHNLVSSWLILLADLSLMHRPSHCCAVYKLKWTNGMW